MLSSEVWYSGNSPYFDFIIENGISKTVEQINNKIVSKTSFKVSDNDEVKVQEHKQYVSRAAFKLSNFLDFLKIADLLECNYRKRSLEYNILGEKIEEENVETTGEAIYYWCENCHCFLLEHSESARRKILLDLYRYFEKWNR